MDRKKLKLGKRQAGATAPPKKKEPEEPSIIFYNGPDAEIKAMLQRMADMKKEMERQLTNIYSKAALSRLDIKEFLENPNNFSRKDWEKVQRHKDFLIEQISMIFTPESTIRRPPKTKEKVDKERRGKTLGARKKWIFVK